MQQLVGITVQPKLMKRNILYLDFGEYHGAGADDAVIVVVREGQLAGNKVLDGQVVRLLPDLLEHHQDHRCFTNNMTPLTWRKTMS